MSAPTLEIDSKVSLQRALHRLWVDHVVWTRQYVVSAIAGAADAGAAASRLLKNQEDIGNALVPFYGEQAGAGVTAALKEHIMIAVDIIDAALKGDQQRFEDMDKKWDQNAAAIAAFLASANPYWPESDVRDLVALHLDLTRKEVVARLDQNYEEDVAAFDDILTEILTLADILAAGIIKQFPFKFGDATGNGASMSGNAGTGSVSHHPEMQSVGGTTNPGNGGAVAPDTGGSEGRVPSILRWRR